MIPILLCQKQLQLGVNTPWGSPQSHLVHACVKVTNDVVILPPGSHLQSVCYASSPTEDTTVGKPEGVSVAWSPESVRVLDTNEIISEIRVLL